MQANITLEIAQNYGLTIQALAYFADLCKDAGNWSGVPLIDIPRGMEKRRGYLTALKKANLLVTEQDEWNGRHSPVWALFTERGAKLAAEIGYSDITAQA